MDVSAFLESRPAPRVVFDRLPALRSRPRFFLPSGDGDFRAITWGAYARAIRELARYLSAEGFKTGERALIFAQNSVEWSEAALAIQAAGGVMVPVYASSTGEQAAYIARHSDAQFLFVGGAELLERVFEQWDEYRALKRVVLLDAGVDPAAVYQRVRARGVALPAFVELEKRLLTCPRAQQIGAVEDALDPAQFPRMLEAIALEQTAIMLYTSGTTGNPKGVPLTHENLAANNRDWMKVLAPVIDEHGVDLLWLPLSHIFGYGEVVLGNLLGFTSYMVPPPDVLDYLAIVRPNVFFSVPSYWEKIHQRAVSRRERLADVTGGRLQLCLSGGAGLKREVKQYFHDQGVLIVEGYGLTETSPTLTLNRPDAFRFDSVGKPLPTVELMLAEDGEIFAKGPNIFSGYFKDPEATQNAFTADGWFKTGDIGRFTDDGFLQIVDRKKDILVTAGGKNIPPANIEVRFRDDPFLAHVVVYGDAKHYLVAGVWLNTDAVHAHLDANGVRAEARGEAVRALVQSRIDRINGELASHERIKSFVLIDRPLTVEAGFLTPTLKVRRKHIYQTFHAELEGAYA